MRNSVGDNSGNLVQAGTIHGGVHFHARRMSTPNQVPRATPHFTNQRFVLASADTAFARTGDAHQGARILVFTGPPGVGKREAARTWVDRHRDDFPDGLFHADLTEAGTGTETERLGDFLISVGFAAEQIPDSFEGRAGLFRTWSADRRVAVVVERALTPAQVRALAPSGAGSAVVVTEAGSLAGLVAGAAAEFLEVAPLEESAALDLFVRIAGAECWKTEPDAVREILRIADGLPIAVCVAASMVAAHPRRTTRLVTQLRDERRRLAALSRDGDDLSITTVFNTAYDRLPDSAKTVYRAVGAHPGAESFHADVVAAGLGRDADAVLDDLDLLVEARLLTELPDERYTMHSLVRAHARQGDTADREPVLRRMLAFYRDRTVAAGHVLMDARGWWETLYPGQPVPSAPADPLGWLTAERENLRAAVDAAHELGEHAQVTQLCVMLWPLHQRGKHLDDLRHCNLLGLESALALGDDSVVALVTIQLGFRHLHRGEGREAMALFDRAAALAASGPHRTLWATAVESQGLAALATGEDATAERLLSENLALALELVAEEPADQARWRRLALARFHLGKVRPLPSALELLTEAETGFLSLTKPDKVNAGKSAQWRGRRLSADPAHAAEAHAELTHADDLLPDPFDRMITRELFGDLAASTGDRATASTRYREALAIAETNDHPREAARLTTKLADVTD